MNLIFDDGESNDGTLEKLEMLQEKYRYIRILYSKKEGFAAAARRLYQEARCPLVFFTDLDGQYVADEFWKAAALIEGCDMAHAGVPGTSAGVPGTSYSTPRSSGPGSQGALLLLMRLLC